MSRLFTLGFLVVTCAAMSQAQSAHKHKRNGDLMYDQKEFAKAEEEYRKANARELTPEGSYNLGNSIYQQQRYEEAVKQFENAAASATDPAIKAGAYYNLGNTHVQAQELEKGIEAYKNSLRIAPDDLDTKKNLTLALKQLQQQQQQQQQEQEQQEQQQEQQPPQEGENQQQQQQQQQEEQDGQSTPEERRDLTKEEAEELLRIIEAEDQRVQEKLRKSSADPRKPKKDW